MSIQATRKTSIETGQEQSGLCRRRARWLLGLLGAGWLAGPVWALERAELTVIGDEQSYPLTVEIADDPGERAHGLMERDHLPADAGMLFVYQQRQPPGGSFWMYRTRIPLAVAFLGADGEIRAIHRMPPCASEDAAECPSYAAGVPFHAALEVNAGYFETRGIEVGDCIELP